MVIKLSRTAPLAQDHQDLTPGNAYRVIAVSPDNYRILNDEGLPYLYPREMFEIVSATVPDDWLIKEVSEDGKLLYAAPKDLSQPGFFEDWFDGVPTARAALRKRLSHWAKGEDYYINESGCPPSIP